ncbi:MAG: 30S ribosomal protein S4 [Candidatus Hydrothermales bacterium]
MARMIGPRCRLCRREGMQLFLKGERCFTDKCSLKRRPYPPGIHGPVKKPRLSIYGLQLREKQKAKRIYGVMEKQFKRYFEIARKMPGNTGENLLSILERRLDNVVFRLGFAISRSQARQMVSHGNVLVNGRKVDIPSYLVKEGDLIKIKEKLKDNPFLRYALQRRERSPLPDWLYFNPEKLEGKILRLPQRKDVTYPIQENLIVELYSK